MEYQAALEQKRRWGNNAPKDIFHIDEILEFYPDARFVLCIRDPRDFLLSYMYKWRVTAASEVDRLQALYHPVLTSLLWRATVRSFAGVQTLAPIGHVMILKYEDLVGNPEFALRKVCAVADLEYQLSMTNVAFSNSSHAQSASGITSASVGRWENSLCPEDVWIAQHLLHNEMLEFGYAQKLIKVHALRLCHRILSTPVASLRALYANRRNRGPLVPYLTRRLSQLLMRR
jgi:hypothetical protein